MTAPQTELLNEHAAIERLLSLLSSAVDSNDDCHDLQCIWSQVECLLLDHIRTEEQELFGLVPPAHRAEVEELRAEHQYIRRALLELGVQVELHAVRKPQVDELVAFLRGHAEREHQTLYRWLVERPDALLANIVHRMIERRADANERRAS